MFDFIGVGALLLLAALGTWLVLRARRAQHRIVKWAGIVVSGLVALAAIVALGVTLVGFYRINYPANRRPPSDIKVAGTPEQVARGARFGGFCAGCHGTAGKPPLVGTNFGAEGPPMGTLWSSNLTAAGEIATWSDGEVIRALREGVHKSGRALVIMPSEVFRHLSDADAEAIVAYLRAQPAAEPNTPPTRLNALVAFFVGAGLGYTVYNNPAGVTPILRVGGYPLMSRSEQKARRKGLMLGVDLRFTSLEGLKTIVMPTFNLGYEAF